MNAKKSRKLRKQLGMTRENHRQKEYGVLKEVKKVVYFQRPDGSMDLKNAVRQTLVNKNLYFYRKTKKNMKRNKGV